MKVYTSAAVTASIPPQAGAKLVLTDIPEDGSAPFYAELAEIKRQTGGYELTDTNGNRYAAPDDCSIFPYLTRNMIYLDQLYEGAGCLIWTDGNETAERIMMFPPYERKDQARAGCGMQSEGRGRKGAGNGRDDNGTGNIRDIKNRTDVRNFGGDEGDRDFGGGNGCFKRR